MSSLLERRGEQRFVVQKEAIGLPGVLVFGGYNYHEAHPGLPSHRHRRSTEIVYLARGEQTYRVGGRHYRMRGGEQFVTFPNEWHDSGGFPEEKGLLFWLVIQPGRNFLNLPPAQATALKGALAGLSARHFQAHPEAEPLLREILECVSAPRDELGQVKLSAAMVRYLLKTCEAASASPRPPISASILRALSWLDENPGDPAPVEALARASGLSVPRLKARFKQEVGVPPREYVLRQKIRMAQGLLQKHSATDTAYRLGFSSSQYFATVFRRFTGRTPSEHQREEG
jgi:AraC-like DNA-binding protein